MPVGKIDFDTSRLRLRHIKFDPTWVTGTQVLGKYFRDQPLEGINDESWTGSYSPAMNDHGQCTLTWPNAVGRDGIRHVDRFSVITADFYEPGEEWIEIYFENDPNPLMVVTPTGYTITNAAVTLRGYDAGWLPKKIVRSGEADFWHHSPRDVIDFYCRAQQYRFLDDFNAATIAAGWVQTSFGTVPATVAANPATGAVRFAVVNTTNGSLRMSSPLTIADSSRYSTVSWRVEADLKMLTAQGTAFIVMSVKTAGSDQALLTVDLDPTKQLNPQLDCYFDVGGTVHVATQVAKTFTRSNDYRLAMELVDGWLYAWVNGDLVGVVKSFRSTATATITIEVGGHLYAQSSSVDMTYFYYRERKPFLLAGADKGDLRVPGAPPPGGLWGEYFTFMDLVTATGAQEPYDSLFSAVRTPYAERVDSNLNLSGGSWAPVGAPVVGANQEHFGVRWTGAIYLDLATDDIVFSIGVDDYCKVWIGKTMANDYLYSNWPYDATTHGNTPTTGLRTHLGTSVSGWYPIRIEFANNTGASGMILTYKFASAGGYTVVPDSALSPEGIYNEQARMNSGRDVIDALTVAYGYQWSVQPRSLESGEFPGQLIPKVRQGRDTEVIIDQLSGDAMSFQVDGDAEEVVDSMFADAAGIVKTESGDSSGQLTAEVINFSMAGQRVFAQADYESSSDITYKAGLLQRLNSLLALRSSPWEQVQVQPSRSARQLVDNLPLTGAAAMFDWKPGDGVRLVLPRLRVEDTSCRQITGATWPIRPTGRGAAAVTFKQRPRGLKELVARMQREARAPQRTYQGQVSKVSGNVAQSPVSTAFPAAFSYLTLPDNLQKLLRVDLVIIAKATQNADFQMSINGAAQTYTPLAVGRYDITAYAKPWGAAGVVYNLLAVTLTRLSGADSVIFTLEATLLI